MHLPDISILGLGYLGLPLAQKFYEQGSQVAAVKRNLTSDDINLPIELDIIDLTGGFGLQIGWRGFIAYVCLVAIHAGTAGKDDVLYLGLLGKLNPFFQGIGVMV